MPIPNFPDRLDERPVPIVQIMLDPNNPRLADLQTEPVPEARIVEDGVQARTLRQLNEGRFDMGGLRNSIRRSGLLPIDRIVVRPIEGQQDPVVVVEGNRRIAAIKTLLTQHDGGEITLPDEVLASIQEPVVLVLQGDAPDAARLDQWVIQGVRHITGIREWGGYQAAKTIQAMIDGLGYDEREVADALNLSLQRVRRSLRVLGALDAMAEDAEYDEYATPDLYAYFDEMIRRPKVREWASWDNDTKEFRDEERARQFFSWITSDDELDDQRRIPTSGDVRQLDPILDSEGALAVLNTPGNMLADALVVAAPQPLEPEWRKPVHRAIGAMNAIPASVLEELENDDRHLLETVRDLAARRLQQADRLQQ